MRSTRRPTIARRCPRPWTTADEVDLVRHADLLAQDIRRAGGVETWILTRLEGWLDGAECTVQPRRRRHLHV